MNILKKLFKNKSKPFFEKKANEEYENMFSPIQTENSKTEQIIFGIVQEVGDGNGNVVAGIYLDDSFKHICKNGKITDFKIKNIPNYGFLNTKRKIFDLCTENFNEIIEFESGKQPFLKNRGIRITFLTSKGIFFKEGQFEDFNNGTISGHSLTLFMNIISFLSQKNGRTLLIN